MRVRDEFSCMSFLGLFFFRCIPQAHHTVLKFACTHKWHIFDAILFLTFFFWCVPRAHHLGDCRQIQDSHQWLFFDLISYFALCLFFWICILENYCGNWSQVSIFEIEVSCGYNMYALFSIHFVLDSFVFGLFRYLEHFIVKIHRFISFFDLLFLCIPRAHHLGNHR